MDRRREKNGAREEKVILLGPPGANAATRQVLEGKKERKYQEGRNDQGPASVLKRLFGINVCC